MIQNSRPWDYLKENCNYNWNLDGDVQRNVEDGQATVNGHAINRDMVQKKHKEKAKSVIIIGDSMIRHGNVWEMQNAKFLVHGWLREPSIRTQPDHFILFHSSCREEWFDIEYTTRWNCKKSCSYSWKSWKIETRKMWC